MPSGFMTASSKCGCACKTRDDPFSLDPVTRCKAFLAATGNQARSPASFSLAIRWIDSKKSG